ncbi:MAG: nuclear transport factor 2 family protein [Promethearchaeota archaeon]
MSVDEIEKIKEVMNTHFEGRKNYDHATILKVWNAEAIWVGAPENKLLKLTTSHWIDFCQNYQKDPTEEITFELTNIDVTRTTACVKTLMTVDNSRGIQKYQEYFILLKIDDNWEIIAQAFHSEFTTKH